MASTTPNIGLTLPTGTEGWKRSVINGNFTILDTKIGAVGNTPLQTQINTLSSQLSVKVQDQSQIRALYSNTNSFEFSVPKHLNTGYSYFLLVGGPSPSQLFVYCGFVNIEGNGYSIILTLVGGTAVAGIQAQYDGSKLTITTTGTMYGGMRLIWLG